MDRVFHFWQPGLNEHESGWIRGLSKSGIRVFVYTNAAMSFSRAGLGLGQIDYGDAEIVEGRESDLKSLLSSRSSARDIHFFTGIREFPLNRKAFALLSPTPAHLIYISESKDTRGIRGSLRFLRDSIVDTQRRRRVEGVLAMGELGTKWFRRIGFLPESIYEFGYAVAEQAQKEIPADAESSTFNIIFAGQLIKRKGIETLLEALSIVSLTQRNWKLEIVGNGAETLALKARANSLGIAPLVKFIPPLKNDVLRTTLLSSDLLVLPSLWDGWGAVVNEALLAGCRIGVSSKCGSSVLCRNLDRCFIFPSGESNRLAQELEEQFRIGRIAAAERRERITVARNMVGEKVITDYLLAVVARVIDIDLKKPLPPWKAVKSVAIVYHFFPHYRKGLFTRLSSSAAFRFTFAGDRSGRAIDPSVLPWLPTDKRAFRHLPVRRIGWGLYWQPSLILVALFSQYDGVIFLGDPHNVSTWIAALIFRIRRVRVLFWAHGWRDSDEARVLAQIRRLFFSLPSGLLLYGRRAKRLATESGICPKRIWVVYNSLEYSLQKALRDEISENDRKAMRRALFGADDVPVVACIGRLVHGRRLDMLIQALSDLKREGHECFLLLIGDGRARSSLEEQAESLGIRLHCTGAIYEEARIAPLLSCAAVTVAPGKVGLTAMHSLAYGVPVVSSGNPATQMPEYEAIVPGLTGELYQLSDSADLRAVIRRWTMHPVVSENVRTYCVTVVERFYNPETQAKIIEAALLDRPQALAEGDSIQQSELLANDAA